MLHHRAISGQVGAAALQGLEGLVERVVGGDRRQFGLVGLSGYVVNLTVFAILTGTGLFFRDGSDGLGLHYIPAAVLAF